MVLAIALGFVVSACGGEGDEPLDATRVCGGLFSGQAAKSLENLTDATSFEHTVTDGLSETEKFLKSEYRKNVNWSRSSSTLCVAAREERGHAIRMNVDVYAPWDVTDKHHPLGVDAYRVGKKAWAGVTRSDVYFECVSPKLEGSAARPLRVHASIRMSKARTPDSREYREAYLTVLHSASLKLAKKMECENSGGLPDPLVLQPVA